MSAYPLPGETITRTLRGVEFGTARPRDEPAPRDIAGCFLALQAAWDDLGAAHQQWRADRGRVAYSDYSRAQRVYDRIHNHLLGLLRRRPGRCYTCDGHRFWLYTEPGGCRRNTIRMEAIQ